MNQIAYHKRANMTLNFVGEMLSILLKKNYYVVLMDTIHNLDFTIIYFIDHADQPP